MHNVIKWSGIITTKASGICVDIRQHGLPPNQTKGVPTMKGITLRPSVYTKLKDVVSVICDFVPELNSVVPCPYRSNDMNQRLIPFFVGTLLSFWVSHCLTSVQISSRHYVACTYLSFPVRYYNVFSPYRSCCE
jgi:hypothetical protein